MVINDIKLMEKFVIMVKKYGVFSLLKSILLFSLFGIICIFFLNQEKIVTSIITNYDKKTNTEHNRLMNQKNKVINPKVRTILVRLLAETKADRAFIMEVHNGTVNPTGQPFTYADCNYEEVSTRTIKPLSGEFERIKLSLYKLPEYLLDNSLWMGSLEDLDKLDSKMASKMEVGDSKYIYVIGMVGKLNDIGLLCLSFVKTNPGFEQQTLSKVIDASQRISVLLDCEHGEDSLKPIE